jgi:hypothetical protein
MLSRTHTQAYDTAWISEMGVSLSERGDEGEISSEHHQ